MTSISWPAASGSGPRRSAIAFRHSNARIHAGCRSLFVRTDSAGNISKRQSAKAFRADHTAGPEPLPGPTKSFAIGLGCDLAHADRLIYSTGIDLADADAAVPIGAGCEVCERPACPQRACPYIGRLRGSG